MEKYRIGDCVSFKMFNRETGETVLEGKGLSKTNDICFTKDVVDEKLIPLRVKMNDNFEFKMFVSQEEYERLYQYGIKQVRT